MANAMHEGTTGTGRNLLDMVERADSRIREWWRKFESLSPELAKEASELPVITDEEFSERGGNPAVHTCASGLGWVWFREAPDLRKLTTALIGTQFLVGRQLASQLRVMFATAVEKQDADRLRQVRAIANAAREWTIEDFEEKLGMPLDAAYLEAGTIPTWAIQYDPSEKRVLTRDEAAYTQQEPVEFIVCCLDGLHHGDSFWEEYTRRLFDATPNTLKA